MVDKAFMRLRGTMSKEPRNKDLKVVLEDDREFSFAAEIFYNQINHYINKIQESATGEKGEKRMYK